MHGPLERGDQPLFDGTDPERVNWPDQFPSEGEPEFRLLSPPQAAAAGAISPEFEHSDKPLIDRNAPRPVVWSDDFPAEEVPEFPLQPPSPEVPAAAIAAEPPAPPRSFFLAAVVTLGSTALIASIGGLGWLMTHRRGGEAPNPPVQVESLKTVAPPSVDVSKPALTEVPKRALNDVPKPAPAVRAVDKKPAPLRAPALPVKQTLAPAPRPAASASQPPPFERVTISPDPIPVPDSPPPLDLSLSKPVSSGVPSGVKRGSIDLAAPASPPRAEDAIQGVLDTFRRAYAQLDAETVGAIWPSVNTKTLGRAFEQLSEQRLEFDICSIETAGATGLAYCSGRATFVPRVGNKTPRVEPRQWTFRLKKVGNAWVLDAVDAK